VIPGAGIMPHIFDTGSGTLVQPVTGEVARLYVCGITPYDATHLGHAATYIAFDLLVRAWRDAGVTVRYCQGLTDVDDPLLERARSTGQDWRELAREQTNLFRDDMTALRVIPPDFYRGVVESVPYIADDAAAMLDARQAYRLAGSGDVYADLANDPLFGSMFGLDEVTMDRLFAERGGDPDTPGKHGRLDPLLWRAERPEEPSWDGQSLGRGRPGWHIECGSIMMENLDFPVHVQGGGSDLIFPHHEMSVSHLRAISGIEQPVLASMHTGMLYYQGEKMSKSLGNLVFVSELTSRGVRPAAIRLALLSGHYRADREWRGKDLSQAQARLERWYDVIHSGKPLAKSAATIAEIRQALANDLDSPGAIAAVDRWVEMATAVPASEKVPYAGADMRRALDFLLGIQLY
jgi:L-cysteine:1D-myo-inositol 2-amino-2-deoxy-alpha-D-glucopyranoside ligase